MPKNSYEKNVVCEWLTLRGSMSQGSWLGSLVFVLFINDLPMSCLYHKFVDDYNT
jgi:hypothetical protein